MCGAILDKDVVSQVFAKRHELRPTAGVEFHNAIHQGLALVAGGQLLSELDQNTTFREWRAAAMQVGRVRIVPDHNVDRLANELRTRDVCVSNDEHVIALAQISGARLLYSNDGELHTDFRNKRLVDAPRGKVYTTRERRDYTSIHRRLLENPPKCANPARSVRRR